MGISFNFFFLAFNSEFFPPKKKKKFTIIYEYALFIKILLFDIHH